MEKNTNLRINRTEALRAKKNKLNILVCPDSFKGSLSAEEAASCIKEGLERSMLLADIKLLPLADGGAGTARILGRALLGEEVIKTVSGPSGKKVKASYFISATPTGGLSAPAGGHSKRAFIDLASASGLSRLPKKDMKPLKTSSRGTGELINDALVRRCAEIFVGLGDSATVDGGAGMLAAMGVKFLDKHGNHIPDGGGALKGLVKIDTSHLSKKITGVKFTALADVTNPLIGPRGAAAVFAPQKGASPNEVMLLEKALSHYARIIKIATGKDVSCIPGGGAAGGSGAGMAAFLDAEIKPGIEKVSECMKLDDNIASSDLVITGEGRVDSQSFSGKTLSFVVKTAAEYGKTVVVFAGKMEEGIKDSKTMVFIKITPFKMEMEKAVKNAPAYLIRAARKLGDLLSQKF
ncbi:glycerate kinase [bacterium]|nr:glycerate kinase [Candidatus Omnitrophota bacterium]MBU2528569.1 glycerate kinase [bacterium]MBU3930351.1 glycerate kinase [bacterium]MBU4123491.1 glycerate kinase [bacterium]